MGHRRAQGRDSESGQASVDFLGSLPAALLVVLVAWQLVLAGHATWLAGNAARVAARADAVGRDPGSAARSALPAHLRRHVEVTRDPAGGRVSVRVRPALLLKRWSAPLEIGASAALQPQGR